MTVAGTLTTLLEKAGLRAVLRSTRSDLWSETGLRLPYLPVSFSAPMIDYQLVYWSGNGVPIEDLSLIMLHDNRPCGLWPLSVSRLAEGPFLGASGLALSPPLFAAHLAARSVKTLSAQCLEVAQQLAKALQIGNWQSGESFSGQAGLSEWHDRALRHGASISLQHELYTDLSPDLATIKSTFRKSFKALVTSGSKHWQVAFLAGEGKEVWEEYRLLHLAVSGRVTRSLESWEMQYRAILNGDAFLTYLRDDSGKMVGGGLFHVTRDEGLYAVGAYDRDLFDKPLGHVVQYHAIETMKQRGVRWYKLGLRSYPGDEPAPTDKDLAISDFKQGFASHLFPRYVIQHSIS